MKINLSYTNTGKDTVNIMNQGQEQFFSFILERTQEGKEDAVKALLSESFAQQAAGTFSMDYLKSFEETITTLLKPEAVEEVVAIMRQFGSQHTS